MEAITKIPGLQHISEDIFKLLDKKSLMNCRLVNSSWKNVLNHPMFWLNKFNSQDMPSDVQRSWKTLVEELGTTKGGLSNSRGLNLKYMKEIQFLI